MDINQMKLCFSTLPCLDYNEGQLEEVCEKHGMDGVEIRMGQDALPYSEKLNIVDLGTGVCFLGYDEARLAQAKEILDRISGTRIKAIRIFLGNFMTHYTKAKKEIDYPGVVQAVQELADYTTKEIWIETHNEFARGRVLKKLLCDVDRENVKVIWDIIHPWEDGETPVETIRYIGKYIAHVHLKDGKRSEDPLKHDLDYTPLGEGELPIREIITMLMDNHYQGYYSLEWENPWRKEIADCYRSIDEVLEAYRKYLEEL